VRKLLAGVRFSIILFAITGGSAEGQTAHSLINDAAKAMGGMEEMVIEADHISPRDGKVRPAPLVKDFVAGLDKLHLDVATIVGIHGDSASIQATRAAATGQ
jgi:hypothetical protein